MVVEFSYKCSIFQHCSLQPLATNVGRTLLLLYMYTYTTQVAVGLIYMYRYIHRSSCSQCLPSDSHILLGRSTFQEEREALRKKDKLLKNLAVMAGFMEPLPNENIAPDVITPNANQVDENLYRIQDGIEELKRSVTEVVDCWNI